MKSASRIPARLGGVLVLTLLVGLALISMSHPAPMADRQASVGRAPVVPAMGGSVPPVRLTANPVVGTPRSGLVSPPATPPAPAVDEFRPVPLVQLRQSLPPNEAWLVRTVLLNPEQGTLAEPGGWAAPARKFRDERHWK